MMLTMMPDDWDFNSLLSTTTTKTTKKLFIPEHERCALCFFGLPRSYKTLVLPSIVEHVLKTNQNYNCDVFVHFFHKHKENAGRLNRGGKIDPNEIFLLEQAVQEHLSLSSSHPSNTNTNSTTTIQFIQDTDEEFLEKRKKELHRYHTTKNTYDGNLSYAAWKAKGQWSEPVQDNMIRQWHSIDAAFNLMEQHATTNNIQYNRVAMLRSDVLYVTPIDIWELGNNHTTTAGTDAKVMDVTNTHFVLPAFANFPVNDRIFYGPYEAVKVWATKRFELVEERVKNPDLAGYVLHSELIIRDAVLPAIHKLRRESDDDDFVQHVDPNLCFIRTRPNSVVLINDCFLGRSTVNLPFDSQLLIQKVQQITKRKKCQLPKKNAPLDRTVYVDC
eukprot:scaffold7514_cov67-Cylindrotheca_fusiformis.AAC.1